MLTSATQVAPRQSATVTTTVGRDRLGFRFAALISLLFVYVAALGVAMDVLPYREWAPLWVVPLLGVLSVPLLRRACRLELDPFVCRVFWIAWALKVVAAIVNYCVQYIIYKGVVDASNFDRYGSALAAAWRSGQLSLAPLSGVGGGFGTHTLQFLTGVFYTVFGSSELTVFFVFSWLGFWGMYLFYRAAVIALPTINRRRYAILIFFWPSLVFWSSALGKDAWTFFFLGLASYGLALALQQMRGGWALLVLGVVGITPVRADITLLFIAGAMIAYVVARLRRRHDDPQRGRFRSRDVVSLLALALLVLGTLLAFQHFFRLTSLSPTSFNQVLTQAARGSAQRHSTSSGSISLRYVLLVLFEPLPFQVRNATSAVVSLEGLLLLWLVVASWARIRAAVRLVGQNGYLAYCLAYAVLVIIAFSSFRNAGTLDRERIQLLPILFVMLSLTPASSRYVRPVARRMVRSRPASPNLADTSGAHRS